MLRNLPLVYLLFGPAALAQPPQELLLTNANVLSPDGSRFLANQQVLIANGHIVNVIESRPFSSGPDIKRIDCTGLYILPGLIDLHTHLLLHSYNETSWDEQVLREPLELRTIRGTVAARATLEAGFTTIRDLGTEGAAFADVALRDAINNGMIPGPRMFVVTRAIVATGCYGPAGMDHRWEVPQGAQEVTGPNFMRKAVREQIAAGADWIKVYADYRRGSDKQATPTFSQEELDALVDEARSAGRPAVAHATLDESIRRAVKAGVATIEHGTDASLETFRLMKEHEVAFCPTLAAGEAMVRYAKEPTDVSNPKIARLRDMLQRALQAGVTIACGSDAGPYPHGENARELELMVAFGMTPQQAILAATATAAKVLHREGDLGQVAPGFFADLIAVRANPLDSISAVRNPALVLKSGTIVVDRQSVPRP